MKRAKQSAGTDGPKFKVQSPKSKAAPLALGLGTLDRGPGWMRLFRRPDLLTGYALPARPGLLALSLLLMFGLCGALASWQSHPHFQTAGIDLLAGASSPKLNITSAEAPPKAAPQPEPGRVDPGPQEVKDASVILPPVSPGDAPSLEPPAMTPMTSVEPALENGYTDRNSQPGDSPMMRNWKMFAFQTLLAGTLIPAGAQAQTPATGSDAPPKPPDTASILKEIQELKKTLSAMEAKVASSFRAMQEDTEKRLKKIEDDGVAAGLRLEKTQVDIEDLKKQVAQLRQDLDVVKNRAPSSRESGYTPPANAPSAATGRVRLVNTFMDPMTIIVNGVRYQVAPGETRLTEPVPAGTFSYEVLGVQPRLERNLAANETFTVTVYPR
jgi:hypothetical protein